MRSRVTFDSADTAPDAVPVATPDAILADSRNFRVRDGALERVAGYDDVLGSLSATAIFACSITQSDGTDWWLYLGNTVAYAAESSANHYDIAGSVSISASDNLGWSGGAFHGYAVVCDGVNIPQQWTPGAANNLSTLSYWPASTYCQVMRFWRDFIFAARITSSGALNPREIRWSDRAQPGGLPQSWDYTDPTNQAGRTELGQTDDRIVDMLALRDNMIVYKAHHTWVADYIQTIDVFQFRQLFSQSGLLTENCVASFRDNHLAVGDSDIIIHDGNSIVSKADGRVRRWFYNRIDTSYYQRSFTVVDDFNREVLICFPETGQTWPNIALFWNWASDRWGVRDLGTTMSYGFLGKTPTTSDTTIDGMSGTFDALSGSFDEIAGGVARQSVLLVPAALKLLYQLNSGNTFNGSTMTCYAERRGLSLAAADLMRIKRVKRIMPLVLGSVGEELDVYVGTRSTLEEAVSYAGPYTFTIGEDHRIDVRLSARYLDIKFVYDGAESLRVIGADIEFDFDGFQ